MIKKKSKSAEKKIKTKGGYAVTNLKKLSKPENRGNLPPMLYSATVEFMDGEKTEVLYTGEGKCRNYSRSDAFINPKHFKGIK